MVINKFKGFLQKLRRPPRASTPAETEEELEDFGETPPASTGRFAGLREKLSESLRRSGLGERARQGNWAALPDKLLAKDNLTQHHRAFLVLLLLGGMWSAGKLTALVLRGRPQFDPPRVALERRVDEFSPSQLAILRSQDPFKTAGAGTPKKIADAPCEQSDTPTSLPLRLINTVVLQDAVKSIASVQVRSGRDLENVHEGDDLGGMARVARILRLSLVVKNLQTGGCELVVNEKTRDLGAPIKVMSPAAGAAFKRQQKIKGIDNVGNKYTISKGLLDEKLKDISQVLTQARAIKIQNPDGSMAFKITEIEPGGIFAYLGIQDQDVITSINGKPISDLNEVMGLFGRIKNIDQLQLGVRREGDDTQLDYVMKQ